MTGSICGILMVVVSVTLASVISHALDKRQRIFHDSGEVNRGLEVPRNAPRGLPRAFHNSHSPSI